MNKIKRTQITIETCELTIIRMRGGKNDSTFCETCRRDVQVFALAQAVLIFRVDAEFLETLCCANQIHAVGENVICAASLAVYFKKELRFVED